MSRSIKSPYKILFTVAVIHALVGTWIWILYELGLFYYPAVVHSYLMTTGFIFSMAIGFLMTAIPKFLDSTECRPWELAVAVLICWSPFLLLVFPNSTTLPAGIGIIQSAWIAAFGIQRFIHRSFDPPPSFLFLPIALLCGTGGSIMMLSGNATIGRVLLTEGSILALILGVGSKLLTSMLGWEKQLMTQLESGHRKIWAQSSTMFQFEGLVFVLGALIHSLGQTRMGDLIWALVVLSIALRRWKFYAFPPNTGVLVIHLWLSIWFTLLGLFALVLFPSARVHLIHIVYVGGSALMTLLVATRVTLAHGGYSLDFELKSKALWVLGICLILAMATRVSAAFLNQESYFTHLAYASLTFCIGLMSWAFSILGKTIKDAGPEI